MHSYKLR